MNTHRLIVRNPEHIQSLVDKASELGVVACDIISNPDDAASEALAHAVDVDKLVVPVARNLRRTTEAGGAILKITVANPNDWITISRYFLDLKRTEKLD